VEGHAVAGGLELALWCNLRARDAIFGVCFHWKPQRNTVAALEYKTLHEN